MQPNSQFRKVFRLIGSLVLSVSLLLAAVGPWAGARPALAAGFIDQKVDPALAAALSAAAPDAPLEVVVVFDDLALAPQVAGLASRFIQLQALPMAGAVLTRSQVETVAQWPGIHSLTLNTPLEYFLHEGVTLVKADQVWTTYGQTGGNVTVAVVDSGIDATHADLPLGPKVIQNVKVLPFDIYLEDQPLTDTSSGHGTHVASTIAGTGASSGGYYRGVAPDAKLVGLGSGEGIAILTAIQAYDWILQHHAEHNIRVVNNSWGSTGGDVNVRNPVVIATFVAYQRGILSVFAAGNDGGYDVMNPYSLAPWVLSVAAGDKDGTLADFSSRGADGNYFKHPDIAAPGVSIYAARSKAPGAANTDVIPNPVDPLWTPHYVSMSGTSMATPHVSGGAALLFSSNPQLSPDQVIDLLTATAAPMDGYHLHEAGYGYMDVLAAYEASLSVAGNLGAFLAGDQEHSPAGVLGFDPDLPVVYDEYVFTGLMPAGALGLPDTIEHPFTVEPGVLYVDVRLTWTPQAEDAFDLEVIDPQGRVVVSSGNGLEEGEAALFVPQETGEYRLRLIPFAAAAAQYEARVKVGYGTPPANWPPNQAPQYDLYLGVAGVYKSYLAVGFISEDFRSGDELWLNFTLSDKAGLPVEGAEGSLQVVMTDRLGSQVISAPGDIFDDGGGEYSYFALFGNNWNHMAPGPITISFAWGGAGSLRAADTGFNLNGLRATLSADAAGYQPGDTVHFSGTVKQASDVAGGSLQNPPVQGAQVTIRLLDAAGNRLASTQAASDLNGGYSGSLVAPGSTRGQTTLVAEATYQDAATALGPKSWYGRAEAALTFPGNLAPSASLYASPTTGKAVKNLVHIEATLTDPDGAADIASALVVLSDARGRKLKSWTLSQFTAVDAHTLALVASYKVSGLAPWTVSLSATDSAGHSAGDTAVIQKE